MKLSIILTTLFSTFASESPDLCAEAYADPTGDPYTDSRGQTLPKYCAWTGPDVPIWDDDVCCSIDADGASCSVVNSSSRCPSGTARMYCKYGEVALDGFVCYRPFPDACEAGWCIDGPPPPEAELASEFIACCSSGGACQYVSFENTWDCQGELVACEYGTLNDDGTIECIN